MRSCQALRSHTPEASPSNLSRCDVAPSESVPHLTCPVRPSTFWCQAAKANYPTHATPRRKLSLRNCTPTIKSMWTPTFPFLLWSIWSQDPTLPLKTNSMFAHLHHQLIHLTLPKQFHGLEKTKPTQRLTQRSAKNTDYYIEFICSWRVFVSFR